MAHDLLSDAALAALYLRRLGFSESEAADHANGLPLAGDKPSKGLLSDLISRHVLRIPFENLEQHTVPLGDGATRPPTPLEERLARLRRVRSTVQRLAGGGVGGVCVDLNTAFAWLLTQLGASARLAMAWVWTGDEFSVQGPTHVVVIVDLPEGPVLADPGFGDPPRTTVCIEGESADIFATYEVVNNTAAEGGVASFPMVLRVKRGDQSQPRNIAEFEEAAPDSPSSTGSVAAWSTLYAFRHLDDLTYDAEDIRAALRSLYAPESLFSSKRIVCLGTPKGHVVLSECRKLVSEAGLMAEEMPVQSDEDWMREARHILSQPQLTAKLVVKEPSSVFKVRQSFQGGGAFRSFTSQEVSSARPSGLGTMDRGSIAVGGAGAGGGLGLNAPGFNVGVKHFAGAGAGVGKKALEVDPAVKDAWMKVVDDSDPLMWIHCDYSADSKSLVLSSSGAGGLQEFKAALGDTISWGGIRCYAVDSRGNVQCKRPKFLFIQHKPECATAMKKAKQGAHKTDVKEMITGAHIDLTVENLGDLDEQLLIQKMQAATGAHKPNGYQFDQGVVLEADFYGLGIGKNCRGESSKN